MVVGPSLSESREDPSAFTTVLHPVDYQSQLVTLPDLLSQQVGVFVKGFGGLGRLSTVSIRGSSAEQVTVLIDGIRINTASGGAVDFSTLPLGSIERIEVLRGGASGQYGSGAMGGVINIVTKRADPKAHMEFKASGGSFFTFETHEGFSKQFKNWGLVLDHSHLSSKGDFSFVSSGVTLPGGENVGGGETFTRLHNAFFSENVLTKFNFDLNEKMRINWVNDFFYTDREEPGPEIETTLLYPLNPLEGRRKLWRNASGVQFQWQDAGLKGLQYTLKPNYDVEQNHYTDPTPALSPPLDVTTLSQGAAVQNRLDYETSFSHHSHHGTFFYEYRFDHFNESSPLAEDVLSGPHSRQTQALFFQDEIDLWANRLFLNPSVRWEHATDFGSHTALHFGAVLSLQPWLQFKTNVENSFRYPTFNELYLPDEGYIRGNPDLKPETALNFDGGFLFNTGNFHGELSYFRNQIHNSIVFVPISAFTIAPVNTGPALAQGLETSAEGRPADFIKLSANYTLLLSTLESNGQALPGRPRHLANGEARFTWKYAEFFSQLQWIGKLPINFTNTQFIRNQVLVNVGATFKWQNHYFFTVEGKNVGNVQTLDSVGFPLPRASVYGTFGYKS